MNRKKTILVLGMMYGVFGLGATIACVAQDGQPPLESEDVKMDVVEVSHSDVGKEEESASVVAQIEEEEETEAISETALEAITEETASEETAPEETIPKETLPEKQVVDGTESEEQKMYKAKVINVGNSRLNLRAEPSMQGEIIGYMYQNNVVEIIELGEEWHYVYFLGTQGYASAMYLQLLTEQEEIEIVR